MSPWIDSTVAQICAIQPGRYLAKDNYVDDGPYWIYGSNSIMGRYDKALVQGPHIVMAAVGANAGAVRFSEQPSWINNNAFAVLPGPEVSPYYLYLWLQTGLDASQVLAGTGQPYVKRPALLSQVIALPPIDEQRRIGDLVTALDEQIQALEAERAALRSWTTARRHHVFARSGSDAVPAGEKFDMLLGRQKSARQSVGDFVIPYVRAANISDQGLRLDDVQSMNFDPAEQAKYALATNDILLVEGGTVGLAARWSREIAGVVGFDKHVIRLRAKPDRSTSEYAHQWAMWSRESGAFDEQATGITIRALGFGRASAMLVPDLDLGSQHALIAPLGDAQRALEAQKQEVSSLRVLRSVLLNALFTARIEIPNSYDSLLQAAP